MIGVELRNPRRLEDEDVATEGSAPHSYWLRYVVLTTGKQMRFASEDELLAAHTVPHYAVANLQLRGAKSFVDARPFGPPPQQPPEQEQQQEMDKGMNQAHLQPQHNQVVEHINRLHQPLMQSFHQYPMMIGTLKMHLTVKFKLLHNNNQQLHYQCNSQHSNHNNIHHYVCQLRHTNDKSQQMNLNRHQLCHQHHMLRREHPRPQQCDSEIHMLRQEHP